MNFLKYSNRMRASVKCWCCLALAALLLACGGCAQLDIGVDVYKGDMLMSPDAKLAKAAALAKHSYDVAVAHVVDHKNRKKELCLSIIQTYQHEHISTLWSKWADLARPLTYRGAGAASASGSTPAEQRARVRLELALMRFGGICVVTGPEIAMKDVILMKMTGLAAIYPQVIPTVNLGVCFEEDGRNVMFLVQDAETGSGQSTVAELMQTAATGVLLNTWQVNWGHRPNLPARVFGVAQALDAINWSNINNIDVGGIGKTRYVVIKDAMGNWHIKTIVSRQGAVVKAALDATTMLVNAAGAYYGIHVKPPPGGSPNSSAVPTDSVQNEQLVASRARRIARQLRGAKAAFTTALIAAMGDASAAKMQTAVKDAVSIYANEVAVLRVPGDQSQNSAAPPSAPAPSSSAVTK